MDFPANLDHLDEMLGYIRSQASKLGVSPSQIHKMELATEEAVVNIISYAFDGREGTLSIQCQQSDAQSLEIIIKDQGQPFDPLAAHFEVDTSLPLEKRKVGGLGIFLIHKMTSKALYERVGSDNILRLYIRKS